MGDPSIITVYQNFFYLGFALAIGKPCGHWEINIGFAFWALEINFVPKTKYNTWFRFCYQK